MKRGKGENWINFFEIGKYAFSKREKMGSKGQCKGLA